MPVSVWMKMTLRLPSQVHKALSDEAQRKNTSLNQLIVDRLNSSVGEVYLSEKTANDGNLVRRLEELEARVSALEGKNG